MVVRFYPSRGRGWLSQRVTQVFGNALAQRVLSLAIPIMQGSDVRTWQSSSSSIPVTRELYDIYRDESTKTMDGACIWRLKIHPRVFVYLEGCLGAIDCLL